jgi:hypothetical protein
MASPPILARKADDHQALLDSVTDGTIDAACNLAREHQRNHAEMGPGVSSAKDAKWTR